MVAVCWLLLAGSLLAVALAFWNLASVVRREMRFHRESRCPHKDFHDCPRIKAEGFQACTFCEYGGDNE